MMDIHLEKKFRLLTQIHRAAHFEWLAAASELAEPGVSELDLTLKFWEIAGHDTAQSYLQRLDPGRPLPRQIAENFVFSSLCMGEDAVLLEGRDDNEAYAQHHACPWYEWHQRRDRLELDQPGCDRWLAVFVEDVNRALGTDVHWETLKSLPGGDDVCLRRFWQE